MQAITKVLQPEELPFIRFFEAFIKAGDPAGTAPSPPWSWQIVDQGDFFSSTLPTLTAGSVVVLDSAAVLKANASDQTLRDDHIPCERSEDWLRSSPRLWALLNHSEPLVIVLHSDGECEIPWPRTTHHLMYRDVWCDSTHQEWEASQAAEAAAGPTAAWLRSIPFGVALDLEIAAEEVRPAAARPLLASFRGSLGVAKPSRGVLLDASKNAALRAVLDTVAEATVGHVPAHPSGVGRYVIEAKGGSTGVQLDEPYPSERAISYLELLRASVFTLSPPGDLWEAYRTYEAIAAGSIPIVVANATYKGCNNPAVHMLATIPGVVAVRDWADLPQALAMAAANATARQASMMAWLRRTKRATREGLLDVVNRMRAASYAAPRRLGSVSVGAWRPKSSCHIVPLAPHTVAAQHRALQAYWRKRQPLVDSPWGSGAWSYLGHIVAKPFRGHGGMCEGEGSFEEKCLTGACNPPLIEEFVCSAEN